MSLRDHQRFGGLTFADFKEMAVDAGLSRYEKIGFPDAYREGKESTIFQDILTKLTLLQTENKTILDIGPGCSELPMQLIALCRAKKHRLILIDSAEMLAQLPDDTFITKIPAFYPNACKDFIAAYQNKVDVVLAYSVLQYIFVEANLFEFMDDTLSLLAPEGQLLLGDIPNASKRKRFLTSAQGIAFHQQNFNANSLPAVEHLKLEAQQIDDAVVFGIMMRARAAGFDSYLVPQAAQLPMANRREDLLIINP